ncbi:MAG TPA: hypothetical protein VKE40_09925 [Gemmataceae bacterium]|nr:hypothetical protein [Gemmataceae bacterium]
MVHFPRDAVEYQPPKTASVYWLDAPPHNRYTVRRGFAAHVALRTTRFLETVADLFTLQSITDVRLVDLHVAARFDQSTVFCRLTSYRDSRPASPFHHWPLELFSDQMDGCELKFASVKAAARALSRAAVAYGRSKAGLPPLS